MWVKGVEFRRENIAEMWSFFINRTINFELKFWRKLIKIWMEFIEIKNKIW